MACPSCWVLGTAQQASPPWCCMPDRAAFGVPLRPEAVEAGEKRGRGVCYLEGDIPPQQPVAGGLFFSCSYFDRTRGHFCHCKLLAAPPGGPSGPWYESTQVSLPAIAQSCSMGIWQASPPLASLIHHLSYKPQLMLLAAMGQPSYTSAEPISSPQIKRCLPLTMLFPAT